MQLINRINKLSDGVASVNLAEVTELNIFLQSACHVLNQRLSDKTVILNKPGLRLRKDEINSGQGKEWHFT